MGALEIIGGIGKGLQGFGKGLQGFQDSRDAQQQHQALVQSAQASGNTDLADRLASMSPASAIAFAASPSGRAEIKAATQARQAEAGVAALRDRLGLAAPAPGAAPPGPGAAPGGPAAAAAPPGAGGPVAGSLPLAPPPPIAAPAPAGAPAPVGGPAAAGPVADFLNPATPEGLVNSIEVRTGSGQDFGEALNATLANRQKALDRASKENARIEDLARNQASNRALARHLGINVSDPALLNLKSEHFKSTILEGRGIPGGMTPKEQKDLGLEFRNQVKEQKVVLERSLPAMDSGRLALGMTAQGGPTQPVKAAQIALLQDYIKILDPSGRITQNEFNASQEALSAVPQNIIRYFQRLSGGGPVLNEDEVREVLVEIKNRAVSARDTYDGIAAATAARATARYGAVAAEEAEIETGLFGPVATLNREAMDAFYEKSFGIDPSGNFERKFNAAQALETLAPVVVPIKGTDETLKFYKVPGVK